MAVRGRHLVLAMLFAFGVSMSVTACGGGSSTKSPTTNRLVLRAGAPPSATQCGFAELGSSQRSAAGSTTAPRDGIYRYDLSGSETVPGGTTRKLPATSESRVTPVTRTGGLSCFGIETRYSARTTNPRVYVIRGDDVYIVATGFDTPNFVATVLPRPAILAFAAAGTRWSGSFTGKTSGSYRVEILERRSIDVGGKSVKAVHLSSRASFRGEVVGSESADTWLADGRSLVLRETGTTDLRFGGDVETLKYRRRLRSITPGAAHG